MKTARITKTSQPRMAFFRCCALQRPARAARFFVRFSFMRTSIRPGGGPIQCGLPAKGSAVIRTVEAGLQRGRDPFGLVSELAPGEAQRAVAGGVEELIAAAVTFEGEAGAVGFPAVRFGYEALGRPEEVGLKWFSSSWIHSLTSGVGRFQLRQRRRNLRSSSRRVLGDPGEVRPSPAVAAPCLGRPGCARGDRRSRGRRRPGVARRG